MEGGNEGGRGKEGEMENDNNTLYRKNILTIRRDNT